MTETTTQNQELLERLESAAGGRKRAAALIGVAHKGTYLAWCRDPGKLPRQARNSIEAHLSLPKRELQRLLAERTTCA
jgi:hypothetical protein